MYEKQVEVTFSLDSQIARFAEACALDAVDFANRHFRMKLDWTDASIAKVEEILDLMYRQSPEVNPSEERIDQFAEVFGSYVGEVFRRNHGADWGVVTMQGNSFPGLRASRNNSLFWPWGRVRNRLLNGSEDNVWHYYLSLIRT